MSGDIDLETLEATLRRHPAVNEGRVLSRVNAAGVNAVVAYLSLRSPVGEADVRDFLRVQAPDAPQPGHIVFLPVLPLDPSGRIDDTALIKEPVIDDAFVQRVEKEIASQSSISASDIVVRPRRTDPRSSLHVDDLLPPSQFEALPDEMGVEQMSGSAADRALAVSEGAVLRAPIKPKLLCDVLKIAASEGPDKTVHFVARDGGRCKLTYRALLAEAETLRGGLTALGLRPGDKVIFQFEDNFDFVRAFWACQLGGFVPAPTTVAPTYDAPNAALDALMQGWRLLGEPVILSSGDLYADVKAASEMLGMDGARVADLHDLPRAASEPAAWEAVADDIALLLFTSGSTGTPKAVQLSHLNIIHRSFGTIQMDDFTPEDICLNWMPLDHVGGVVMCHIRDVCAVCDQVQVSKEYILSDIMRWLDLIEEFGATFTWAPNFAFALVNDQADRLASKPRRLDSLRFILNAGEAISARTTRRFMSALEPYGLSPNAMFPVWGMSETSSGITCSHDFRVAATSDDDPFVNVGRPAPGTTIKILRMDGSVAREGEQGRLFISGPTVTSGYFKNREATEAALHEGGWLETGDLGVLEDGALTITGRLKNILIVNGINYNCHEIEAIVDAVEGVETSYSAAAAIRRPGAETDELAIFFAPSVQEDRKLARVISAIRDNVTRLSGLAPSVVVPLDVEDIPKTSIGKIQHTKLLKRLEQGDFDGAVRRADLLAGSPDILPQWFLRRVWGRKELRRSDAARGQEGLKGALVPVFAGDDEFSTRFCDRLSAAGASVVKIYSGARFVKEGMYEYAIRPDRRDDMVRVLRDIVQGGKPPWHVVYLWSADAALQGAGRRISDRHLNASFHSFRAVSQALAEFSIEREEEIILLSASVRAESVVSQTSVRSASSLILGYVRSVAQEAPNLHLRHIDLEDNNLAAVEDLFRETATSPELEIGYRGGVRYVPFLAPESVEPDGTASKDRLRRGGCYLVTGGLGGVGYALSEFLLKTYAADVILLGRTKKHDLQADDKTDRLRHLESLSGRVFYCAADIAEPLATLTVTEEALSALGRSTVDGVFHLAGAYEETPLLSETRDMAEAVAAAKVFGAVSLDGVLQASPDAFFIGFSSQIALFGAPMAGAYAAANQYIDSFAADLRSSGRDAYSINWTVLGDLGLAKKISGVDALRAFGIQRIGHRPFLASLRTVLAMPPGQIIVGLDPANSFIQRRLSQPFGSVELEVVHEAAVALRAPEEVTDDFGVSVALRPQAVDILPRLATGEVNRASVSAGVAADAQPMSAAQSRLAELWRRILNVTAIAPDTSFFEAGGQSLMATELIAAIQEAFGVEWSLRDIFEYSTLAEQAARLESAEAVQGADSVEAHVATRQETTFDLTPAQSRIVFMERLSEGVPMYNIEASARFHQGVDVQRLKSVLQSLLQRHDALRGRFYAVDGELKQVIAPTSDLAFAHINLGQRDAATFEAELAELAEAEARRPFDLAEGPLARFVLVELPGGAAHFIVNMHHIITDGWSVRVFFEDLISEYNEGALPQIPYAYTDYVERQLADTARFDRDVAFWRQQLDGVGPGTELATDFARPAIETFRGKRVTRKLSQDLSSRLSGTCRGEGVSLFVYLLTAFKAVLARYTQAEDISIGSVAANREAAEVQRLIGFLINVIVLRTHLPEGLSFRESLRRVQASVLDAHAHAQTPFETIVETLQPERDLSRAPFFQIAFDVHDENMTASEDEAIDISVMDIDFGTSKYDIHLTFKRVGDELAAVWEYAADLFAEDTITNLARSLEAVLDAVLNDSDCCLCDLLLLDSEQHQTLTESWAVAPRPEFLGNETVLDLFEAQMERRGDACAVSLGDQKLSYAELSNRSDQLARYLQSRGVRRGSLVAVCFERCPDMATAILGVLKAGAAYVPIDPTYPEDRITLMLEDAAPALILTLDHLKSSLGVGADKFICLDTDWSDIISDSDPRLLEKPCPDDLAYVIFTSGSTGRPKGVMVEHRGVTNLVRAQIEMFEIDEDSRLLQFAAFGFDASVSEIFTALCAGAVLCFGDRMELMPGPGFARFLQREKISVVTLPPSVLRTLPASDLPDLRTLVSAGEACDADLVRQWGVGRRFVNAYGPTENTVCATMAVCVPGDARPPSIGAAMANVEVYVLDTNQRLVPPGVTGELYLGGAGLARGYLNRPDLTAERFTDIAVAPGQVRRLYRTGDRVRWRADGALEYAGRADDQVKLRGFRIELEEVETVLRASDGVENVAVAIEKDAAGDDALVAYVARAAGTKGAAHPSRQREKGALEFWPSLAEFFVYDELIYHMMTNDTLRNDIYRAAINRLVKDKVVLDIGTGRDAILSRLCIEGGARKVYAVELLDASYDAACKTVASLGLEDRIEIIHGDATKVTLPEPADVCVSEIVGAIGGSEGAAHIINEAWRLMAPDGVMIPSRSKTMIAAVSLPQEMLQAPSFSEVAAGYVEKIFDQVGYPFDLRLCIKNGDYGLLRSSGDVFEDLDYTSKIDLEADHEISLNILQDGPIDGFLVWLKLETADGEWIDCLRNEHCWIPVYLPAFYPAVDVKKGDVISARVHRTLCDNGLNPDFRIVGEILRPGRSALPFECLCNHDKPTFQAHPFYKKMFEDGRISVESQSGAPSGVMALLRRHMERSLPAFMRPDEIVLVDEIPLTPNGKVDRKALRRPAGQDAPAKNGASSPATLLPGGSNDALQTVLEAWAGVLGKDNIGLDDNFFDIGGNSIKMAELQSRLEKEFGCEIQLVTLFQYPTVRRMSSVLAAEPAPNGAQGGNEGAPAPGDAGGGPIKTVSNRMATMAALRNKTRPRPRSASS